jgi:hypothetical protein
MRTLKAVSATLCATHSDTSDRLSCIQPDFNQPCLFVPRTALMRGRRSPDELESTMIRAVEALARLAWSAGPRPCQRLRSPPDDSFHVATDSADIRPLSAGCERRDAADNRGSDAGRKGRRVRIRDYWQYYIVIAQRGHRDSAGVDVCDRARIISRSERQSACCSKRWVSFTTR